MDQSEKRAPRTLVILAEGAEEMEVTIVVDVLRRAGIEVTVAGLDGSAAVACSRGVRIVPDTDFETVRSREFDCVVLPGGAGGSDRLAAAPSVGELLTRQISADRIVAAVCAAPAALAAHGVGSGRRMTSHPSVADTVSGHAAEYSEESVVVDGQFVTSRGPGTAFEFAFKLIERLCAADVAQSVRAPMMFGE